MYQYNNLCKLKLQYNIIVKYGFWICESGVLNVELGILAVCFTIFTIYKFIIWIYVDKFVFLNNCLYICKLNF